MTADVGSVARRDFLLAATASALQLSLPSAKAAGSLAVLQEPNPIGSFPTPDLANLYEVVNWISENKSRTSFLDSKWTKFEEWKQAARPDFRRCLGYDPKPEPLSAQVISRERRDGFSLEAVRIRATSAYEIPAWVLIPDHAKWPAPGVIACHDHGGNFVWGYEKIISYPNEHPALTSYRDFYYGRPYVEALAKKGYVVLVIDAFYFGSRRLRPEDIDPATAPSSFQGDLEKLARLDRNTTQWFDAINQLCGSYEHLTAKTIFAAGAVWPGILVWDDMRSVDYLMSRPEVDPKRIGCLGLSGGGLRTAYLIAADPRIKVACVTGWMTEFPKQLRNYLRSHTWMAYIPGLSLDLPDAAAMIAPGALMVQQCLRDSLYPLDGLKASVAKLNRIYAKAGIPERFSGLFYDVPHSFRPNMQEDAFSWIERWI